MKTIQLIRAELDMAIATAKQTCAEAVQAAHKRYDVECREAEKAALGNRGGERK